ncbi:MAG TPA: anaerobic ribonucleoside-triphosphate reductase activating protein [Candidatus Acidoferrum sp.]|nr:anaerobic ribonucleoside-triphosphate reductase activating protein [Candidatus Acidoferrum sp.]
MKICGLQKLTLLDYPEKLACTVFTGGCNFRCPFCHNASLVLGPPDGETLPEEELFLFLKKRVGVLAGVCVTGGEPLIHEDLPDFLRKIKELGYAVKLDTNGYFPGKLKELVAQGLVDYVAMDVKSDPAHYAQAAGLPSLDYSQIAESIRFLLSEPVDCEFRTTVVGGLHDADILRNTARSVEGAKRYFLQQFVDSGDLIGSGFFAFSDGEMKTFLDLVSPCVKIAGLRGV